MDRQRRKILLIGIGVVCVVIACFGMARYQESQHDSAVVINQRDEVIAPQDVFLIVRQGEVLRDPFRTKNSASESRILPVVADEKKRTTEQVEQKHPKDFRLDGVVTGEGERVAIISINKESGVYKEHDRVGGYELAVIDEQGVRLRQNNREFYLRVGGL